jgi:hypothetical protein
MLCGMAQHGAICSLITEQPTLMNNGDIISLP